MAIKLDKTTIIVCSVVGSLGVLSAIFGFSAEGTKLTPYTILVYGNDCIYPQNPAIGLGICAVIFLLMAQITISAVGGCCGCCKSRSIPSETKRIVGIVCAVVSWIAAVIAWALLIQGAAWNANVVRETEAAPFCPYLKDGIFAGAGVLTLVATALGIISFIMLRRPPQPPVQAPAATPAASSVGGTPQQSPLSEVVMGRPLLPPPSKAQAYVQVQQQVPPTAASHPQGNGVNGQQAPQDLQAPPLPPAAGQHNGPQQANQQFLPQGLPAAAACPPQEPASQQPPRPLGVQQLPQVPVPNDSSLQYAMPVPVPHQVCAEIPATPLAAPGPSQGNNGLSTAIRNELARATIRLAGKAVEHAVFSNNAGDILSSMVTDDPTATGVDVGATTYNGVAAA